jgi:hypothetical protein
VTDGDRNPEGLITFKWQGGYYLLIANEVSNTTTLYSIGLMPDRRLGKSNVFMTNDPKFLC